MEDETVMRVAKALERSAFAQEELIRLATEERDTGESLFGPPLCPHCATFNPNIRSGGEGDGPMATFVLVAECLNCHKVIYAVPQGWLCYDAPDKAKAEIEGRTK